MTVRLRVIGFLCGVIAAFSTSAAFADLIGVDHLEGNSHGFLTLKSLDGTPLADGEITQVADNDKVTGHLVFKFKDGSVYDDTAVYTQHGTFRLVSDHRVERGPSFKHFVDTTIDAKNGVVTVHFDGTGKEKDIVRRRKLPEDVANGIFMMLLNHIPPKVRQTSVSFVAATPDIRMVNLVFTRGASKPVRSGELTTKVVPFNVHVKIPGLAGALAKVAGKQPPDITVWVVDGTAPTFVRYEGFLYVGGPVWRIEMKPNVPVPSASKASD